ncbi:amidohydrolase [Lacihabitans sp. LS3-19]|uniref:amidohydrolase family protein n=1 Tax=Lacihabitans sp. LS3-19 TaxID=2487335 RepID=UPI0020CEC249|nr:amidohydrolase family protein [Lacihabitans sp. LS3-19]MCP9769934.1 amidohydrolase [Lacihabitans sp. LS3-19]
MRKNLSLLILFIICKFSAFSQETFHENGVKDKRPDYYLFKNATVHVDGKTTINEGWVLIKGDKIEKVGKNFDYPKTTQVMDMSGKHIYPGFVDIYSDYGMPEIKRKPGGGYYNMEFKSGKEGAFAWNQAIKPEVKADEIFKVDDKSAAELRKIGFGATVTHQKDGIARGNSALVSLNNTTENEVLLKSNVSSHFSFDKGSSIQSYPVSLMGSVALLRQAYYDAKWYTNGGIGSERNLSLEALAQNMALPAVFHGKSFLDAQRADKIGKEFGIKYILKSGGDDYKRISEIKELNTHIIAPISFPKALDVEDPLDAEIVSLTDLKNWEMAPSNLAVLAKNNISFSISPSDLVDKSQFFGNIQKAIKLRLDKNTALDALTSSPAKALKIDNLVGSIKNGMIANLLISNEEIFDPKAKILENWIQGNKFVINDLSLSSVKGTYSTDLSGFSKLEITGENEKPSIELFENDSTKVKATTTRDRNFLTINYKKGNAGLVRLSGYITDKKINGDGKDADGKSFVWNATLNEDSKTEDKKADSTKKSSEEKLGEIIYPFTAFGNKEKPSKEDFIIKNATIWTNEADGNIQGDVIIKNGKIDAIGKNLASAGLKVIDGTNKHLTNGIIDEHSHIALFSINEVESVSSEVRQEDVVNSEDINIYRQLAGGVTTSQLLHGSADCIGGQSAIIKLKWGESADKLIIPNSPKFIKFALGENVKRGNSPQVPNRYPSTRMGVEQVFTDAFTRAIAYKKEWATYNGAKVKTGLTAPRTDLELVALVEILDGKRNITCHSYVQSEINMLMKLADSLGFKINTFTHILEGYKVADKMKARNINGSTFSDWWAYKMEVKEAIPYNAAIMTKVGVNTAINSDDAEMARRLNQEAAKTMLYGGLSEAEAWKTVTLNPAKMLHLDERLGSIKKGKDADLVLWTDNPLSVYAKPEKTIIDGTIYFDLDKEAAKIEDLEIEKNRIIQKLLAEKSKGTPTVKPTARPRRDNIHCDAILEYDGVSVEQLDQFLENLNK